MRTKKVGRVPRRQDLIGCLYSDNVGQVANRSAVNCGPLLFRLLTFKFEDIALADFIHETYSMFRSPIQSSLTRLQTFHWPAF